MVVLDVFIVNAAIPAIERDFRAGPSGVEWLVTGYNLAFAAAMITGGRLGDCYGRRRMFAWGLALFTVTSVLCGVAGGLPALVAARVGQGLAAAALVPQVSALINLAYDGSGRVRAYSCYALTLGGAAVGGQVIGGALIAADLAGLGWRACFLVNVPVGVAALLLVGRHLPAGRADGAAPRLDLVGAGLATAGLVAVVLPLAEGPDAGWPWWTWVCLAGAAVLFTVLVTTQRRIDARGGSPLLPPALFTERGFAAGLVNVVAFYLGVASWFFVLALYLQDGRQLSPLRAGAVFSALGAGFLLTSVAGGGLVARLGRQALALGAGLRTAGLLGLWLVVRAHGTSGEILWVALPMAVDGAGQGLVTGPLLSRVLLGVRPQVAGAGSGVLASAQQVGNSVGVALIGAVFVAARHSGASIAGAFGGCLLVLAGLSLLVAGLVQLLPKTTARPA